MQITIAILGSAFFFVVAPCTLAGLIPWSITRWELRPPFFGLELTRVIGVILILAGVPGLVDLASRTAADRPLEVFRETSAAREWLDIVAREPFPVPEGPRRPVHL